MNHRFTLEILDTITDPGKPGRPNEDRFGFNDCAAFVLDGATGLGDRQFMEGFGSDFGFDATDDMLGMGDDEGGFNRRVKEGPEKRLARMVEISEERAAKILRKWAIDQAA